MSPKILVISNTSWSLYNFRLGLLRSLKADGWEVAAAAPEDEYSQRLQREFTWIPIVNLNRKGYNPLQDLKLLLELLRLFSRIKPRLVLCFTIKPNIYSALASRLAGIKTICSVTGLGYTHGKSRFLSLIINFLYRFAFSFSAKVAFQNREDLCYFTDKGLISKGKGFLTPGSGVDLKRFSPVHSPSRSSDESMRFIYIGRMLWEKGIGDYVAAARLVKDEYPKAHFSLLGPVDQGNPKGISFRAIENWERDGSIDYLGSKEDVRSYLDQADVFVFPSYYREGIPKALLEAMAMEKPIITTDSVGCREAVEHGENGFLVPKRNPTALAAAMLKMIRMDKRAREKMGRQSRVKAKCGYDERFVIDRYKVAINEIAERT